MSKGINVEIKDGDRSYHYPEMNWMKYKDGKLTISYQDENNWEHVEVGDVPTEIIFHPYTMKGE